MFKKYFAVLGMAALVAATAIGSLLVLSAKADTAVVTPTGLTATAGSSTSINLAWNGAGNSYQIFRNGSAVASTTGTSFIDMGLSPATTYNYNVSAFDSAGSSSPLSTIIYVQTLAATTTPTTTPPSASSTAIYGWVTIPQSLYNQIFNVSTSTAGSYTYVNGYPTINGNYYDCGGNLDNDMAHHITKGTDSDSAHHIGKNCPGGSPQPPSANNHITIPLTAEVSQALWQAINVNHITAPNP